MVHSVESERGAVAVLVALTLIVLVGVTSLAVDGGAAYNERRSTQNAADHAALAAAWAACNSEDPDTSAHNSAALNGYTATDVTVTEDGAGVYTVEVEAVRTNSFGGAIGAEETTIRSQATAECDSTEGAGNYAIFAGAPPGCSGNELNAPNAVKNINGGVHSNGDFSSTGATATYTGSPATYVGSFNTNHPASFLAGVGPGSHKKYPVPATWVTSTYAPGSTRATEVLDLGHYQSFIGNRTFNNGSLQNNRLIYVEGNVQIISGPGLSKTNVTIVATGTIQMSGASTQLTPYEPDGLVLFSDAPGSDNCSTVAIHGSAAGNGWQGIMYAPHGEIRLNNAGSMTLSGGLIGYRINLAGAATSISNNTNYGGAPEYTVEVTK